tara:strand:- start:161 stop:952 length:792 start_codon:yes stop_codon:yes gene_type:complete
MRIKPKKSLGQNFLINTKVLSNIVNIGGVSNDDVIIEIGPGTGNLTEKIIDRSPKELYVVEKDKDLSNMLKKRFGNKIFIINKDILDCYDEFKFNIPIKVFGNLPYNISTKILISFIKMKNMEKFFERFIFVFQKEVAERIIAKVNSKNYGRISIITSWRMDHEKVADISPNCFDPVPKVWSSLVLLKPKLNFQNLKKVKNLEHITNIFFNQRRKMIKKPMRDLFYNFDVIAKNLNIDLNLRPQNLSKDMYIKLCKLYENLNQ